MSQMSDLSGNIHNSSKTTNKIEEVTTPPSETSTLYDKVSHIMDKEYLKREEQQNNDIQIVRITKKKKESKFPTNDDNNLSHVHCISTDNNFISNPLTNNNDVNIIDIIERREHNDNIRLNYNRRRINDVFRILETYRHFNNLEPNGGFRRVDDYSLLNRNRRITVDNPENLINGDLNDDITILSVGRDESMRKNYLKKLEQQRLIRKRIKKTKYAQTSKTHKECVICYEQFKKKSYVALMKCCNFVFHYKCLKPWYNISTYCPICKKENFN